jgi:hypothetical protein
MEPANSKMTIAPQDIEITKTIPDVKNYDQATSAAEKAFESDTEQLDTPFKLQYSIYSTKERWFIVVMVAIAGLFGYSST